ncbi:FIG004655: Polysaccharide deacetylase [hydrothermal vent metagenome]|uniref:FIG004655: Polysaccharide deacetylase n=1 Tax=hydrothermal vent metagenome TaxID=652676 RepID=A0A3B0ZXG6_9ZZZZ
MNKSNVMSVDVEDYYQVSAFAKSVATSEWEQYESRVVANTQRLLDLFAEKKVKATFFVLGWVADREPQLVKKIHRQGHEIASHGYSHQLIYNQTPEVFKEETIKSKQLLEDLIGEEVLGYRAASYSITKRNLWALDILAEAGFVYDSSIFPIRHDRYGIADAKTIPHKLATPNGAELVEFPLTTRRMGNLNIPVAGGGYFRLYPYFLTRHFLKAVNKKQGEQFVFYLHPWEVDPQQPRIEASWFSKFRHYNNLEKCESRLSNLMDDFNFTTMKAVLTELNLLQ